LYRKLLPLMGLLVIATLVFGCSSGKGSTTAATSSKTAASETSTKPGSTTTTGKPASGQSLADVLGRVSGVASVKYNMVVTSPNSPAMDQAIFVKKNKMRTETTVQGQTTILLADTDAKTMYMYMPSQNSAFKMTWDNTSKSAGDASSSISKYNPVILGTETMDGKVCLVVQYTAEGTQTKMWIWQEKGLPVRIEANTAQGLMVMQYKNFEFVDIPDSQFVLPSGVKVSDFPGMGGGTGAPSLPTGMPSGLPSGIPTGLPSGIPTGIPTGIPR
jgi:outer membrane lipoprotein-sorting protein